MYMPSSMQMGMAEADIYTSALVADLRAEYMLEFGGVDLLPHAGVRYTALRTSHHDLNIDGQNLNSVESDTQHIVQFPIGLGVSVDTALGDWRIKPSADISVIPVAGETKAFSKMRYSGVEATDSVNTRIMDSTSYAGLFGLQAEKGNFSVSLNYGVQAASHETDQNVQVRFGWKF
jgi:uncharacterized protein with beta-barrel porin domain